MPFPKGMQLTLLELPLVLKSAIYFFLYGYKSSTFSKFGIAVMKIIKKGFEHLHFSGDYLFLIILKIKLFITFWGLDFIYVSLICKYKKQSIAASSYYFLALFRIWDSCLFV